MLALRSYEKKNKDGFAAMTADELKFINGGDSSRKPGTSGSFPGWSGWGSWRDSGPRWG